MATDIFLGCALIGYGLGIPGIWLSLWRDLWPWRIVAIGFILLTVAAIWATHGMSYIAAGSDPKTPSLLKGVSIVAASAILSRVLHNRLDRKVYRTIDAVVVLGFLVHLAVQRYYLR